MSRVQRLLNVDKLHSKFKQNAYSISADLASDPPPAFPGLFRSLSPRSFSSKKKLNMRLLDIQIFDDLKFDVFLDWKLRILDKLRYNVDYFTRTIDENRKDFKIIYIISELSGEASIQTL